MNDFAGHFEFPVTEGSPVHHPLCKKFHHLVTSAFFFSFLFPKIPCYKFLLKTLNLNRDVCVGILLELLKEKGRATS